MVDTPTDATITYDRIYYSNVYGSLHTLDPGFNITSGLFKADGYEGYETDVTSYVVTYSMQFYSDEVHPAGNVYLHKNGQRLDESYMTSGGVGRDMASRTMIVELAMGDTLSLYCSSCYEVLYTNICIRPQ